VIKTSTLRPIFSFLCLLSLILSHTACQTSSHQAINDESSDNIESKTSLAVAASYIDAGRPDKALGELKGLLEKSPNNVEALNLNGLAHLSLNNPTKAAKTFERAWKIESQTATGVNLSSAYIQLKKYADAEKILTNLIKRNNKPAYAHRERIYHNYGLLAIKTKRLNLAENMFKKATEENPMFHLSHMELYTVYAERRKHALALTQLERARFACPTCYAPIAEQVKWYRSMGDERMARRVIQDYKLTEGLSMNDRRRAHDLENQAVASSDTNLRNLTK
jgi:Tfp pilus assembly protein PilF